MYRSVFLPLICALTLVQEESPQAFAVSSESSLYAVRGRLAGTLQVQPRRVTVVVRNGSVLSVAPDPGLQFRAVIATATPTGWKRVAESEPRSLGAFDAGQRRELTDSIVFTVKLPSGAKPEEHWLVFQFRRSDGTTTYACSDRNLSGPDSLSSARAQQLRTFYPLAC